jgi:hypothetical protein
MHYPEPVPSALWSQSFPVRGWPDYTRGAILENSLRPFPEGGVAPWAWNSIPRDLARALWPRGKTYRLKAIKRQFRAPGMAQDTFPHPGRLAFVLSIFCPSPLHPSSSRASPSPFSKPYLDFRCSLPGGGGTRGGGHPCPGKLPPFPFLSAPSKAAPGQSGVFTTVKIPTTSQDSSHLPSYTHLYGIVPLSFPP